MGGTVENREEKETVEKKGHLFILFIYKKQDIFTTYCLNQGNGGSKY